MIDSVGRWEPACACRPELAPKINAPSTGSINRPGGYHAEIPRARENPSMTQKEKKDRQKRSAQLEVKAIGPHTYLVQSQNDPSM